MKTFLIILLVAAAVVADDANNTKIDCGENASYHRRCGCRDFNCQFRYYHSIACIGECHDECFCIEGYIRGPKGTCIHESDCPVCPPNEHYEHCGTSCERTCETVDAVIKCSADCARKCFCNGDMVRHASGKCIARDRCPL